jgi:transposase-like protein
MTLMAKKPTFTHCPRCGSENVVNFTRTLFCKDCKKKFNKDALEELEDDQILSEKEKSDIFKAFKDFAEK